MTVLQSGGGAASRRPPRPPWSARALLVLGSLIVLSVPAGPLSAQSFRVIPQIGLYAPMSDLGEVRSEDRTLVEAGRRSSSLAFGLGVEAAPLPAATAIRAQLAYATSAQVPLGGFECPACLGRSSVLTATLAAVLRPAPRLVLVQPHFLIGAGVKRYDFDPRTVEGDVWRAVLRDQTRPALQVGAGLEVRVLGVRTQWELAGFLSTFRTGEGDGEVDLAPGVTGERSTQSDLFLTLAFPLGS